MGFQEKNHRYTRSHGNTGCVPSHEKEFVMGPTIFLFLGFLLSIHAADMPDYYGELRWDSSDELKENLHKVLTLKHVSNFNAPDTLLTHCPSNTKCYSHSPLSYKNAREHLFGNLHLEGHSSSTYSLTTYYCDQVLDNSKFNPKDPLAPMNIPDPKVVNAEHSWPQSKFSNKFSKETQKSDLHILFPVSSSVNSTRSNHPFGEVTHISKTPCSQAALGKSAEGLTVFEPSDSVKGDIARALFYYSIRYKSAIDPIQENYLRQWHSQDPPDAFEEQRNQEIFEIQKVRNPFIDSPDLAREISDF